jgi:hypothetical protein
LGITNTNRETERAELIKKLYALGFEVGLKNHSEIGWVLREYNNLLENAHKLGIKSPEIHYHDGKLKGKKNRDKGTDLHKAPEKVANFVKKVTVSEIKIESGGIEEFEVLQLQRKPDLNELPNLVKKTEYTEIPRLLDGFKPLGSSRFGHGRRDKG